MGQRRKASQGGEDRVSPLSARIDELELRIRLLEARLRETTSRLKKGATVGPKPTRKVRARPRCPGCLLELPKGPRAQNCVWCGFYLPAVKERAGR